MDKNIENIINDIVWWIPVKKRCKSFKAKLKMEHS